MHNTGLPRLFGLISLFVLCLISIPSEAGEVRVAVDANFADAIRTIAPMFEKVTGHTVKTSYGSTSELYAQIQNGTPYDVFMAADTQHPSLAIKKGLGVPGSEFVYARGRLMLWSASPCLFEDGETYLRGATFDHLAIANPETTVYGLAAQQVMTFLGVWDELQDKLVRGDSITQTFQLVATENADIGFITASQLRAWKGDPGSSWEIPADYYDPIDQAAVLLLHGKENPAVYAFIDFLKSDAAHKVIKDSGYSL
jgi:molybdate transport system substrate-binding protein